MQASRAVVSVRHHQQQGAAHQRGLMVPIAMLNVDRHLSVVSMLAALTDTHQRVIMTTNTHQMDMTLDAVGFRQATDHTHHPLAAKERAPLSVRATELMMVVEIMKNPHTQDLALLAISREEHVLVRNHLQGRAKFLSLKGTRNVMERLPRVQQRGQEVIL